MADMDLCVELVWYTRSRTWRGSGTRRVFSKVSVEGFVPSWACCAS